MPSDATREGAAAGTVFDAVLSGGDSARARQVRVRFTSRGLLIESASGEAGAPPIEIWPYDALTASGPLLAGESPLLGHRDRPGTRLFIHDPAARTPLLRHARQLSGAAHRRRVLWPVLGLAFMLLGVGLWLYFSSFSLARVVADMLPRHLHDGIGRAVVSSIARGRVCNDPNGVAALRTLALRLAGDRARLANYRVLAGKAGVVNAFTAPGGYIVLSEELIRFARSPDEVAGVLAHEMGHADHRHPEAGMVRAAGLSVLGMVLLGNSDIGGLAVLLTQMGFSRQAEREADEVSIRRMRAAGMNPAALADFLRRLEKRSGGGGSGLLALLSTHPPTPERIERLRGAAPGTVRPALDTAQWRALRGICSSTEPLEDSDMARG